MAFPGNGERIKLLDDGIEWFEKVKASSFATGVLKGSLLIDEVKAGLDLLDSGLDCLREGKFPSFGQCQAVGEILCSIVDTNGNRVAYYNDKGVMLLERVFSDEYSAGRAIIQNQPNGRQFLERAMKVLNSAKAVRVGSANANFTKPARRLSATPKDLEGYWKSTDGKLTFCFMIDGTAKWRLAEEAGTTGAFEISNGTLHLYPGEQRHFYIPWAYVFNGNSMMLTNVDNGEFVSLIRISPANDTELAKKEKWMDEEKKIQNVKLLTAIKSLVLGIIFAGVAYFYFVHPFNFLYSLEMGMGIAVRESLSLLGDRHHFPIPVHAGALASEAGNSMFRILPQLFVSTFMAFVPLIIGAFLSALIFMKEREAYRRKLAIFYGFCALAIMLYFFINTNFMFLSQHPGGPLLPLSQHQFFVGDFGFIELIIPMFMLLLVGNLSLVIIALANRMQHELNKHSLLASVFYIIFVLISNSFLIERGRIWSTMLAHGHVPRGILEFPWIRYVMVSVVIALILFGLSLLIRKIFQVEKSAYATTSSNSYRGYSSRKRDDRMVKSIYNNLDANSRKTLRDLGNRY